ncbi:MAG TPA: hypothetical protein VFZ63_09750 [Jiangellaceae bacterium]
MAQSEAVPLTAVMPGHIVAGVVGGLGHLLYGLLLGVVFVLLHRRMVSRR